MKPETNLRGVCAVHAPKPDPKFAKLKPEEFVGKWVKKAFEVNKEHPKMPQIEHIWVKITAVKAGGLIGTLANQPLFINKKFGDKVSVQVTEIEALSATAG